MLARLFIVLLLATSLSTVREWTMLESSTAIEVIAIDIEPVLHAGDVTVGRAPATAQRRTIEIAREIPRTESAASSPDLGRVFRPPRLLGA